MKKWKLPPKIKVLEATGALADGRVRFDLDQFIVLSSDKTTEHKVTFDPEKNIIISTDRGSRFKGYLGYPSIAVLMLKGRIPFDKRISEALKGIEWKKLNDESGDYKVTEAHAKKVAQERGVSPEEIEDFVKSVLAKLGQTSYYG